VLRAGIIAVGRGLRVEDDVGNLAGLPLVGEQGAEFEGGAADVEVGEPDGYERAVPAPLVRIKFRSGTGPTSYIVFTHDLLCLQGQLFVFLDFLSQGRIYLHLALISSHITWNFHLSRPPHVVEVFAHPHPMFVD
jgi:hypothetical protein